MPTLRVVEAMLGARIRAARERAGLRAQDLGAAVGLDSTAISKIENGKRAVKSAELSRIAEALHVSPLGLLDDESLLANLPVAARTAGRTIAQGDAYQRIMALAELHSVLDDSGLTSHPQLHDVPNVHDLPWLEAAESLASWTRDRLELDGWPGDERLSQLIASIESAFGIDVVVEDYPDDPLSGAAVSDRRFPLVFVNARFPSSRCLFTLAHELGHVLAGHGDSITLDRELSGTTQDERMVNAFAAILLMPEDEIRRTIEEFGRSSPAALIKLTQDFGVSFESLVFRLHNLRIINAASRDKLRDIGWAGLRSTLENDEMRKLLGDDKAARFKTRGVLRPAPHPPIFLTQRAMDGYRKGVISIRPLTSLLDEDEQSLAATLDEHDDAYAALSHPEPGSTDDPEDQDQLFAGSPV